MDKELQSQIHVVTAYFDIGWHGRPGTVKRSNDWYLTNFAKLAQLQNPMSIFTQESFKNQISEIRGNDKPSWLFAYEDLDLTLAKNIMAWQDKPVQDDLPFKYIFLMWCKPTFIATAYKHHGAEQPSHYAWVDFAGLRHYAVIPHTPIVPHKWEYDFNKDTVTLFSTYDSIRKEDRICGSTWVAPSHLATWLAEAFIKAAMQLASKEGFYDDEYVLAHLVKEYPDKFTVLPLGKDNFFGALSVYNNWENK